MITIYRNKKQAKVYSLSNCACILNFEFKLELLLIAYCLDKKNLIGNKWTIIGQNKVTLHLDFNTDCWSQQKKAIKQNPTALYSSPEVDLDTPG